MNNENNSLTFIIVSGILVLIVFTVVTAVNLLPNYESNSYFAKVDKEMSVKIETTNIEDGQLIITTSGNPVEFCVKSTRTEPTLKALCWKKMENNKASIAVFQNKKYYIWIKDKDGNISNYLSVNSSDNK